MGGRAILTQRRGRGVTVRGQVELGVTNLHAREVRRGSDGARGPAYPQRHRTLLCALAHLIYTYRRPASAYFRLFLLSLIPTLEIREEMSASQSRFISEPKTAAVSARPLSIASVLLTMRASLDRRMPLHGRPGAPSCASMRSNLLTLA